MRILIIVLFVFGVSLASGACSNPCADRCQQAYDKIEETAGSKFSGPIKEGAEMGLTQCKAACG
jgi:hypothetical protein